jgi:RNA recognition motif-containing protein
MEYTSRYECCRVQTWNGSVLMYVNLFVGNLPWSVGDVELEEIFRPHGDVQRARVINDRETGRSRGFGFVEMEVDDIVAVINATNGREIEGRPLRVNEAESKGGGGGGGGGNRRGGSRPPRDRY